MSKRFTDSAKWQDGWFLSLDNDTRIIWQYLLDTCTIAGRWKKNLKLLNFCCNTNVTEEDMNKMFLDRLIDKGDYYFIPKFIKFQNPTGLNSNKPIIKSIRKELIEYGLDLIISESFGNDYLTIDQSLREREYERDRKGKEKGMGKEEEKGPDVFCYEMADKFVERAKKHFKTVTADRDKFADSIFAMKSMDGITEEIIRSIINYLQKRPDVGKKFCWFDQIGTPEKLRHKTKDGQFRIWEKVLQEYNSRKNKSIQDLAREFAEESKHG